MLEESVQYKPDEESTKVTLYADDTPIQVIDLKDIDDMSEEEYNDKLKDAWFKKTHYETVEELTMEKYYSYEVKDEENTENDKSLRLLCEILGAMLSTVLSILIFGGLIIGLFWILGNLVGG